MIHRIEAGWMQINDALSKKEQRQRRRSRKPKEQEEERVRRPDEEKSAIDLIA